MELFTVDFSLQAIGAVSLLWLGQKIADNIVSVLFDRKVFYPIFRRASRRWKIFKTKADKIASKFIFSFTLKESLTVEELVDKLDKSMEAMEEKSNGKISIESKHWELADREGKITAHYSNKKNKFDISVKMVQDTEALRENPATDPSSTVIKAVGFELDFFFPFKALDTTLFNLGSLISNMEKSLSQNIRGSFSNGRFEISPLKNGLTIDEWVSEKKFDVSLLLTSEESDQTEVEFFSDRAVVKSNEREIDGETVDYLKGLLLNYYL